jgi:hypothetical protein
MIASNAWRTRVDLNVSSNGRALCRDHAAAQSAEKSRQSGRRSPRSTLHCADCCRCFSTALRRLLHRTRASGRSSSSQPLAWPPSRPRASTWATSGAWRLGRRHRSRRSGLQRAFARRSHWRRSSRAHRAPEPRTTRAARRPVRPRPGGRPSVPSSARPYSISSSRELSDSASGAGYWPVDTSQSLVEVFSHRVDLGLQPTPFRQRDRPVGDHLGIDLTPIVYDLPVERRPVLANVDQCVEPSVPGVLGLAVETGAFE